MNFWDISKSVVNGIVSIPVDVYYGSRRTFEDAGAFGQQVQADNAAERARIIGLIKSAWQNNEIIYRLIRIIVGDFVERMPQSTMERIEEKLKLSGIQFGTRKGTQFALANFLGSLLAERIVTRAVAKRLVKFGVGMVMTAILIQGILERSSNASQRLQCANPYLYRKLAKENLDVLYFLAEEELAPFVQFTASELKDSRRFNEFVKQLEDQIQ